MVGANIIQNKKGEILLVQESKEVAKNQWNLPAGSFESKDGKPRKTAVREAKEEAQLEIEPEERTGIYIDTTEDNSEKVFNFVYHSKIENQEPETRRKDTVKDLQWFKTGEIENLDLRADYIKKAVEEIENGRNKVKEI